MVQPYHNDLQFTLLQVCRPDLLDSNSLASTPIQCTIYGTKRSLSKAFPQLLWHIVVSGLLGDQVDESCQHSQILSALRPQLQLSVLSHLCWACPQVFSQRVPVPVFHLTAHLTFLLQTHARPCCAGVERSSNSTQWWPLRRLSR